MSDFAAKDVKPQSEKFAPSGEEFQNEIPTNSIPTILQLQRQYGNRTVQRLINDHSALQRVNPHLATLLQRQVGPRRLPPLNPYEQQDVIINTVGTPLIMPNGGFEWLVDFQLPNPAAGDGYIIQECRHNSMDLSTNTPLRAEWHYWEAWRVRRGAIEPVERGANNCHDIFRYTVLSGRPYERNSIQAIVRFYATPDFPWGNGHPLDNPTVNFFHDLPQPPIWNGSGVRHEASLVYDARGSQPQSTLTMINGTQTTVLNDPPTPSRRRRRH